MLRRHASLRKEICVSAATSAPARSSTSALDVSTESAIIQATEALIQGRTTFIIAHRLSTIQHCDILLELDAGHLKRVSVQSPARSELLATTPEVKFATVGLSN